MRKVFLMAECIIARGGGKYGGDQIIPIVPGYASILVTAKYSTGEPASYVSIDCNDGGHWYNYHMNEKGQTLFMANSGGVDISLKPKSVQNKFVVLFQNGINTHLDCPAGTSYNINMNFTLDNSYYNFTSMASSINSAVPGITASKSSMYSGNCKIVGVNKINVNIGGGGGGGGGGSVYNYYWAYGGQGGGGGGAGEFKQLIGYDINSNTLFKGYVGSGGEGGIGSGFRVGSGYSGGTSSIFSVSATGGEGGKYNSNSNGWGMGGNGANGGQCGNGGNGGPGIGMDGINSAISIYGGGGGGGGWNGDGGDGGYPGGGDGGYRENNGKSAHMPGGGGGGGGGTHGINVGNGDTGLGSRGGSGGSGIIQISIYN